ncbi:MAG: hypothetical protein CMM52_15575 [Rhodospirillaceae bacterium]|nr:hypothetical protein [Rhodospirillaceae bacterium]|tara:strand:+ start:136132 stop:136716 length:585 start_codon:yes stop_codon:yes gene_type:complete
MRQLILATICAGLFLITNISVHAAGLQQTAANNKGPQTLQQKRNATRARIIGQQSKHCALIAARLRKMQVKPCIADDRLDPKTRLCMPRKKRYMPYSRWDPAAGRCRPRDKYDLTGCAGKKGRYRPGKHHAQLPLQSARMYSMALRRMTNASLRCQARLQQMRKQVTRKTVQERRACIVAKHKGREDIARLFCK